MSHASAAAVVLGLLMAGCGGGGSSYEREASSLCRSFNEAAFAGNVANAEARRLYRQLGEGFSRLAPPEAFMRTHRVLVGFARDGEATFVSATESDAPMVDLRLVVGNWEAHISDVARDLPDCADTLTGRDREPEVILIR